MTAESKGFLVLYKQSLYGLSCRNGNLYRANAYTTLSRDILKCYVGCAVVFKYKMEIKLLGLQTRSISGTGNLKVNLRIGFVANSAETFLHIFPGHSPLLIIIGKILHCSAENYGSRYSALVNEVAHVIAKNAIKVCA